MTEVSRECAVCHRKGTESVLRKCSSCKAILYCSEVCLNQDWSHPGQYAHSAWCARMKMYMEKTEELAKLPFTFMKETSAADFDGHKYRLFLKHHGVLGQGMWRRETSYLHEVTGKPVGYGDLDHEDNPYILPVESIALDSTPDQLSHPLTSWADYFSWRGLRLHSPVAILLQWPLTVYYIMTTCLPRHYPDVQICGDRTFHVYVIGAEKEADLLPTFTELTHLMPGAKLALHISGPGISKKKHQILQKQGIVISVTSGYFHELNENQKPDLIIGLNAGLGAYMSWCNTLKKIKNLGAPAYFTDYCQYSCECARMAVEGWGIGTTTQTDINPFRCPVRRFCEEQAMPWYCNGFIYRLLYEGS